MLKPDINFDFLLWKGVIGGENSNYSYSITPINQNITIQNRRIYFIDRISQIQYKIREASSGGSEDYIIEILGVKF